MITISSTRRSIRWMKIADACWFTNNNKQQQQRKQKWERKNCINGNSSRNNIHNNLLFSQVFFFVFSNIFKCNVHFKLSKRSLKQEQTNLTDMHDQLDLRWSHRNTRSLSRNVWRLVNYSKDMSILIWIWHMLSDVDLLRNKFIERW